jgi:hypothetical protein
MFVHHYLEKVCVVENRQINEKKAQMPQQTTALMTKDDNEVASACERK